MTTAAVDLRPRLIRTYSARDMARWTEWARRVREIGAHRWVDYGRDPVGAVALGRAAEALWVRFLGGDESMLPPPTGWDGGVDFRLWGRAFAVHWNHTPDGDLWFDERNPLVADVALSALAVAGPGGRGTVRNAVELAGWAPRTWFTPGHPDFRAHPPRRWTPKGPGALCLEREEIVDARDRLP